MVTESLARGVPVIVRQGTGAVEALAAGSRLRRRAAPRPPPEPPRPRCRATAVALAETRRPLAAVLRRWLAEPELRAQWRAAARDARERLPGWDATARAVLAILGTGGPGERRGKRSVRIDTAAGEADGE